MRRVNSVVIIINNKLHFRLRSEVSIAAQRATFCALRTSTETTGLELIKKSTLTVSLAAMWMTTRRLSNITKIDAEDNCIDDYEHESSSIDDDDSNDNNSNSNNINNRDNSFIDASSSSSSTSSSSSKDDKTTYFDVQDVDPSRLEHFYWNASSIDADNDDMDNEENMFPEMSEMSEEEVCRGNGENDHSVDISRFVNPAHYKLIK